MRSGSAQMVKTDSGLDTMPTEGLPDRLNVEKNEANVKFKKTAGGSSGTGRRVIFEAVVTGTNRGSPACVSPMPKKRYIRIAHASSSTEYNRLAILILCKAWMISFSSSSTLAGFERKGEKWKTFRS